MMNFIKEVFNINNLREVVLLAGLRNPKLNYGAYVKVNNTIKELDKNLVLAENQSVQTLREVA